MRFIALDHPNIEIELIRIALREYGNCEFSDNEDDLIQNIIDSKDPNIEGEPYSAIFIYPGDTEITGFDTFKKIRALEKTHEKKMQVIFLCENKNSIYLLETISTPTESFVSKNIIKREILETLMTKKIIT